MGWKLLADTVVMLHFGFVVFAVGGGLLVLRWPKMIWVHLPALAWGAAVEGFAWLCPLTLLENDLRMRAGDAGYQGGFVDRYIIPALYPESIAVIRWYALAALIGINAGVYYAVWRRAQRRRAEAP